jgi:hypothetical protein
MRTDVSFHRWWFLRTLGWALALGVGMLLLIVQVFVVSQGRSDFCQDYIAARWLLQGKPIYAPLHCWTGYIYLPVPIELNPHPPFAILPFLPLALLPQTPATIIWGLCSLAAYLGSGWLLLREIGWLKLQGIALFVLGSLLWHPVMLAEQLQNSGQMLLLLLVVAWLMERHGQHAWAGGSIGLAGLLRIWPLALLFPALLGRQWRQGAASGAVVVLGGAVTLLTPGSAAYGSFFGSVRANEQFWIPARGGISLVSAIVRPFTGYGDPRFPFPPLVHALTLTQAVLLAEGIAGLLLLGGIFFLWRCQRQVRQEPAVLLSQSLLLTLVLVCFPITWDWGLLYLLLPGTILILALRRLSRPPCWWYIVLSLSLVPLLEPDWFISILPLWLLQQTSGWRQAATLLVGMPTYGLLLFAGLQSYLLWKATRQEVLHGPGACGQNLDREVAARV